MVEDLGFDSAWTYDHLSWRSLQGGPWYSAFPVLTAAACVTSRITLGTLVSSPNFRHPVTLAKDAIAVDDISHGRFTLGVGSGSIGAGDSNVITREPLPALERAVRFEEFVVLLDKLLRQPVTTHEGRFFSAFEAHMTPGCTQQPRLPLAVAATGPMAQEIAVRHGDAWVTAGPAHWREDLTPADFQKMVGEQLRGLRNICDRLGRDYAGIDKIFVATDSAGDFTGSASSFMRMAESYAGLGITDLIIHWPRESGIYSGSPEAMRRIAKEALPQLASDGRAS
jgi:alkanesulfonate monooxygenase SsuD/methylene tetrahydromethanopterin reductase-like flavin-dependent oxidoreductase (luciferase family)